VSVGRHSFKAAIAIVVLSTAAFAGVTISSPYNNQTVGSSVHFIASATGYSPITSMMLYIDNSARATVYAASFDKWVSVSGGKHRVDMKAWDNQGRSYISTIYITEGTADTGGTTQTVAGNSNIDQQSGWLKCTSCGWGDMSAGYMSQWVHTPSMDGNGMQFALQGTGSYRNALWYKGLGGTNATHLVYDLYFYITQPNLSEALEFDINQYVGGRAYVFGHQCSPKASHTWDVYDKPNNRWVSTGISCPVFPGYTWNHVTLEVERTWDQKLHYISITYNGTKHYVNKYISSTASSWYGLSVDVQLDGDYAQHNYSTWVDKMNLSSW
jgi:hypothetical protein